MTQQSRGYAANWYPDPQNPSQVRWWDGTQWTPYTQPLRPQPSQAPAPQSQQPSYSQTPQSQQPSQAPVAANQQPSQTPTSRPQQSQSGKTPFIGARKRADELQATLEKLGGMDYQQVQEAIAKAREELEVIAKQGQESMAQAREGVEVIAKQGRESMAQAREGVEVIAKQGRESMAQAREGVEVIAKQGQEAAAKAREALGMIDRQIEAAKVELATIQSQVANVRQTYDLQEVGLYDFEHPAEASADLSADLAAVRQEIKYAISDGQATTASTGFTFNNSLPQGRKFVDQLRKAMLAYYNSEAENCIKAVRAGNLQTAQTRLDKAVQLVQKNGEMISLRITPTYHRLRSRELSLAARYLDAVQREKEMERVRRAEQREQDKAERELQAEHNRLEKERQHYVNAVEAMKQRGDLAGIADLESKISDVDQAMADVDFRVANIKAGYVYVISNVGAFGPDVVKIGMTRRLDPMDRVRELGGASVPFRFDVHALFFAENAVEVETSLHHTFFEQRLNKINAHREFFRVSPSQVLDALKATNVHIVEYTVEPTAEEFRLSGGDVPTGR